MWFVLYFVLSGSYFMAEGSGSEDLLGEGIWELLNMLQCDDVEQYEVPFYITRRKINRTHDAFSINADFDKEIDLSYGIEVLAYKEVDGGFKFYQQLTDDSFCNFLLKYTNNNWVRILEMANVDPPECPIPKGKFIVKDFVMDYESLEKTGLYGSYDAYLYLIYQGRRLSCLRALMRFDKHGEDDEHDDE